MGGNRRRPNVRHSSTLSRMFLRAVHRQARGPHDRIGRNSSNLRPNTGE